MPKYVNANGQLRGWEDVVDDIQEAVKTGSDVLDTGQDIYRKYAGSAGSSPSSNQNGGIVPPDTSGGNNSQSPSSEGYSTSSPPSSSGTSANNESAGIPTWAIVLGACVVGYLILK